MTDSAAPDQQEEFLTDRLLRPEERAHARLLVVRYAGWILAAYGALLKLLVPTIVAWLREESLTEWWHEVSLLWLGVGLVALLTQRPTPGRLRAALWVAAALGTGTLGLLAYELATRSLGRGFAAFSHVYYAAWVFGFALLSVPVLRSRHLRKRPE